MTRIGQSTKVIAEGDYEKIFRHNFETVPEEQLLKTFACCLSTSAGPVMGILYLSSAKFAFCSDDPLSYTVGDQTAWSYYKLQENVANKQCNHKDPNEKLQWLTMAKHRGCSFPILTLAQGAHTRQPRDRNRIIKA
ncbi:hypothetical protein ACFX2J_018436 [Malus domestica]